MREGRFIQENKARWESYRKPTRDPDELARRLTCLVDDLSYARTFYPYSEIVKYINGLAADIYLSIYKNKKQDRGRLAFFFLTELPLLLFKRRKILLFSLLFFITFVAIGAFSSWQDPDFVRSVLGDEYVTMTENNIAKGEPFGVYKNENNFVMFLYIAWNNIRVAFLCFISGLFFSVGTLWLLFKNGVMLGTFEQLFFAHGIGGRSLLIVFIHGTLEISAIVIAGSAGIILGNALLFPKTYTRLQSLISGAKDGIKIIVSLVPIFLVAAFFEGYVTRHDNMPLFLNILILAGSLLFIFGYFVWYPRSVYRRVQQQVTLH
jgi:uncharacterized membrane protein SpoIIM required for sporulation